MEVRVERAKRRVVLVLNGIHGPLQWRDLQTGGTVLPPRADRSTTRSNSSFRWTANSFTCGFRVTPLPGPDE
jgi:hypothetical protein